MPAPIRILLAEDSPTQATFIRTLLQNVGYSVEVARDGVEAWEIIQVRQPDAVLTDLQMPEMDGLELVEAVAGRYSGLPIILMTALGSEEVAARALSRGAASYVPKLNIETDIIPTLERVLAIKRQSLPYLDAERWQTTLEREYEIANDDRAIPQLIARLQDDLTSFKLWNDETRSQVGMAFDEALVNAIHHGNLEASSFLRNMPDAASYHELVQQRRSEAPYCERKVFVKSVVSRTGVEIIVRDEGPGFDPSDVPDPTAPENLNNPSGRGLMLIENFMDEVVHNESGNTIKMIKLHSTVSQSPT